VFVQPTPAVSVGPEWRIENFDEIDSTNRWLVEQSVAGAPSGLVAIARTQSAGRGRLGRTWVAPPGTALLMSVLVRPEMPVEQWHLLGFHMALAASRALTPVANVSLKWPNDLQMDRIDGQERKLAGILAQAQHGEHGGVVIGIGVNLLKPDNLPAEVDQRGVWLSERGIVLDAETLASQILEELGQVLVEPLADVIGAVRSRCTTIGRRVRVELGGTDVHGFDVHGTAIGIADDGALLVETSDGIRTFHAGDVVHLR
jgi:BirA family transcriptional regulator, biotin operon repressor / biotin---[acetyl-CoA-carboxylase] ligase